MGKGGGGSPTPPATPPPANETTAQALQSELQYRPQFREQDVADILAYGEAAAKLEREQGFPLAMEERELYKTLEPETFEALQKTGRTISDTLDNPLSATDEENYRERFRAEEAASGRLGSPVGSASIARNLADVTEAKRLNAMSAGLSYLGRAPLGTPNLPIERGTQEGSFVGPSLGYNASVYNTQGGIYGSQLNYRAQQGANRAQIIGAGIGAAGRLGGAFIGGM